jgi:glycosyltransferase involved in cell wall biosynthesis
LNVLPKISIITPSYNQGQFIEETIQSVLAQNYPEVDYIIIDGASQDQSARIIEKYAPQLSYWVSEPDKGQTAAINKGLRKATGDIITWINSDDILTPGALFKVAECFDQHPKAALIHGKSFLFGNKVKEQIKEAPADNLAARYLSYIPFPQPSSFFRRQVIEEQGLLDESLHYGMDYDLLVRIALNYPILKVDHLFSHYRIHQESKTATSLPFAHDWARVYSKLLRSMKGTDKWIEALEELGLYHKGTEVYSFAYPPEMSVLEQSFCFFIEIQIHYHYDNLELETTKKLLRFLKKHFPGFYQDKKLDVLHIKTNLGKKGISFFRQFTR